MSALSIHIPESWLMLDKHGRQLASDAQAGNLSCDGDCVRSTKYLAQLARSVDPAIQVKPALKLPTTGDDKRRVLMNDVTVSIWID